MSSTQSIQRELYLITRSEATWLVETFMNAKKKGADGSIEPYRVFRDELETAKPAYLGQFNNTNNSTVQGAFYKIATNLYKMLTELNRRVAETDHHQKTMDAAKLLPCKHSISYLTGTFLNWAVYNWNMKTSYPIAEDLGDNGFETNTCAICDFTGYTAFYFSTAYGLEKPVCECCLPFDANDYKKEDAEYVLSEDEEESEAEEEEDEEESEDDASEADEAEEDDDEEEYKPSLESEAEEEEDDELDDEYTDEESEDEADVPARVVHKRFESPSPCPSDNNTSSVDDSSDNDSDDSDYSDSDSEKSFGCSGCNYEWKAGYKYGYKTAMKEISKYADEVKDDAPSAPRCATCNMSHESLKKCGGCKTVRYCSERCQTEDWTEHKRVCRR
jgi:hypothetical protein